MSRLNDAYWAGFKERMCAKDNHELEKIRKAQRKTGRWHGPWFQDETDTPEVDEVGPTRATLKFKRRRRSA